MISEKTKTWKSIWFFTKIESIHNGHTQHVHQVSSESVHNFLRYRAIYHFWAPSLNGEESLKKTYQIWTRIRIFTKIESVRHCHAPTMSTKFHPYPSTTLWDIPHTDRETNKQMKLLVEQGIAGITMSYLHDLWKNKNLEINLVLISR